VVGHGGCFSWAVSAYGETLHLALFAVPQIEMRLVYEGGASAEREYHRYCFIYLAISSFRAIKACFKSASPYDIFRFHFMFLCGVWGLHVGWYVLRTKQVQVDFFERAVAAAAGQGGALSDRTARALTDFTHPNMFAYFQSKWGWSRSQFEARNTHNCNGAFSAWSFSSSSSSSSLLQRSATSGGISSSRSWNNSSSGSSSGGKVASSLGARIMEDWVTCALDKACVCPEKSNRGNHRQDQAALSLTMAMHGLTCRGPGGAAKAAKTAAATAAIAAAADGGGGAASASPASSVSSGTSSRSASSSASSSNGRKTSRRLSANPMDVDPYQVHWVRTHATRPKRKSTSEVLAAHAPKCLPAYEAAVSES
jgi:hypothetical protein